MLTRADISLMMLSAAPCFQDAARRVDMLMRHAADKMMLPPILRAAADAMPLPIRYAMPAMFSIDERAASLILRCR